MRLETIMSRGDLPASEKKLVTNFREGWGSPVRTEWGFLAGCLLFVSWLRMEAHLSRGKGGRGGLLELRGLGGSWGRDWTTEPQSGCPLVSEEAACSILEHEQFCHRPPTPPPTNQRGPSKAFSFFTFQCNTVPHVIKSRRHLWSTLLYTTYFLKCFMWMISFLPFVVDKTIFLHFPNEERLNCLRSYN